MTDSAASQYFTFANINVPSPALGSPEFNWALVKKPLVVPATNGYGLDYWRQLFGSSRTINSGYRDPAQNVKAGGVPASRHQLGDAVDLRNQTGTLQEWLMMFKLALKAHADDRSPKIYLATLLACMLIGVTMIVVIMCINTLSPPTGQPRRKETKRCEL